MEPQNPYESPQQTDASNLSSRRLGLAILLGMLTIPAAGIAFYTTGASLMAVDFPWIGSGIPFTPAEVGAVVGAAVAVAMIYMTVRAAKR